MKPKKRLWDVLRRLMRTFGLWDVSRRLKSGFETSWDVSPNIVCIQSMIFTCRHKVIERTCGPKISQNVFSSPNRPEKVLNGIPQMFGTPWKKDHLGLEKSMLTKYGVWDTWDDFSFFTPKKNDILRTGTYRYVPLRTNCRMVRTSTYLYIPVRTCTYRYVQSVQYVPVRTGMYQYIHNVRTGT